ncbi:MAG TPA: VOC family protein [Mycobacteriales bacterium]
MARLEAFVIRCVEPARLAPFYAAALGLPIDPGDAAAITTGTLGADEAVLLGRRDHLHGWLIRGEPSPTVSPGVHLDIRLDDPHEREALLRLGATHRWFGPDRRWEVLADPEGNLLCVFPPATS